MVQEESIREYQKQNIPAAGYPQFNEAWALIEASRRIASVIQFGDFSSPTDKRKLRDALRLNLRIWTIIQAEQTVGEDVLPEPIRQNILTLCKFIDQHTLATMINPTPEKAVVLININRNIASGLLGQTEDEPEGEAVATEAPPSNDEAASREKEPVKIDI